MTFTLGIDTSCYTSSLAVADKEGNLYCDARTVLQVPPGERGLRQSEGVFQHIRNLPILLEQSKAHLHKVARIVVSASPRSQPGSYMPVFTAGLNFAKAISLAMGVPLLEADHQIGHILAGLWSAGSPVTFPCLGVHLSGGTTEFFIIEKRQGEYPFKISLLGGTQDLHAGQFVDRVGVALGLSFPAGPKLEKLASRCAGREVSIPSSVKGYQVSFSGPETCAQGLVRQGEDAGAIAKGVFMCVANTVAKVLNSAIDATGIKEVLCVGGVAANGIIRERLKQRLEHKAVGAHLLFAAPRYSSDNAVGLAFFPWN